MSDEVTQESKDLAEASGLTVQPDPVHNDHPSAHDLVVADIELRGYTAAVTPANLDGVYNLLLAIYIGLLESKSNAVEEMQARREFGLKKYGTTLQPFNGRDHIADSIDELGDLLVYVRSYIYEVKHNAEASSE